MNQISTFLTLLLLCLTSNSFVNAQTVGFYAPYEDMEKCNNSNLYGSYAWFVDNYVKDGKGIVVTPSTLNKIKDLKTLWVAYDEDNLQKGWEYLPTSMTNADALAAIKQHVKDGGSLFLSSLATQLLVGLDRIDATLTPNIFNTSVGKKNFDLWGVNPIMGKAVGEVYDHSDHAIYKDLFTSEYKYPDNTDWNHIFYPLINASDKADHNCIWDLNGLSDLSDNPNKFVDFQTKTNSVILGTWQHVVDYAVAGVVEFQPTADFKGTILTNGMAAYDMSLYPGGAQLNDYMVNLYKITENTLEYLNSKADKVSTGIEDITFVGANKSDDAYYTLQGVKVASPLTAGIYVHNHKKVVVR